MGDRRRRARGTGRHCRAGGRPASQDHEVRGQHHFGHRHQDQHGVRLDRGRRRQHRRELAAERLQPRGPRQHRHRRSRPDRRSRGLPRLRARRPGRGDPQGRAQEGSATPGDLSQAARDPRAAQQAVGVRDRRLRALRGEPGPGRDLAEGRLARTPARSEQPAVRRRRHATRSRAEADRCPGRGHACVHDFSRDEACGAAARHACARAPRLPAGRGHHRLAVVQPQYRERADHPVQAGPADPREGGTGRARDGWSWRQGTRCRGYGCGCGGRHDRCRQGCHACGRQPPRAEGRGDPQGVRPRVQARRGREAGTDVEAGAAGAGGSRSRRRRDRWADPR